MKVIDVLNVWADDEDVKVKDEEGYFANIRTLMKNLNSEVEIIEDTPKEDKKIPKVKYLNTDLYYEHNISGEISNEEIILDIQTLKNYINKIIDKVNSEDNELE